MSRIDLRSVMFAARPTAGPHPEIPRSRHADAGAVFAVDLLGRCFGGLLVQVDAHDVRAFLDEPMGGLLADAAAGADDDDDLAGEFLFRRHALQLRLFEEPVFDVERLLLRQGDVFVDRFGAAHHFHGAVVELGGNARLGLVLAPGDHAEAGNEDDRRIRVAHRGRVRMFAAFVIVRVVLAVSCRGHR